jgi:hypothetical protein
MNFIFTKETTSFELKNISPLLDELRAEAEKYFSLVKGAYTISYVDMDGDPIAVEDDDDLAVCILEFSEMSKIDDPVTLLIESSSRDIPRRRDTPKGSGKSSPRLASPKLRDSVLTELPKLEDANADRDSMLPDSMSQINFDETASQLSEKVISMVDSKIGQSIDSKLESMLEGAIAKKIEASIRAEMKAKKEAENKKKEVAKKAKAATKLRLKEQKAKKQKEAQEKIA